MDLATEFEKSDDRSKLVCSITPIDVHSAIARRVRMAEITPDVATQAKTRFAFVTTRFTPWPDETFWHPLRGWSKVGPSHS